MPNETKKGGYGKRPLWFWIVLYLVIGAIVYFLVYYFFFSGNKLYNNSSTYQGQSQSTSNY